MSEINKNKGVMLVLSSPSGAGKSSICKALLNLDKNLFLYTHFNRLHGPMVNNNHIETPSLLSAESISNALDYKFNDFYSDQLNNLDIQIGLIIGYLKSNNMVSIVPKIIYIISPHPPIDVFSPH